MASSYVACRVLAAVQGGQHAANAADNAALLAREALEEAVSDLLSAAQAVGRWATTLSSDAVYYLSLYSPTYVRTNPLGDAEGDEADDAETEVPDDEGPDAITDDDGSASDGSIGSPSQLARLEYLLTNGMPFSANPDVIEPNSLKDIGHLVPIADRLQDLEAEKRQLQLRIDEIGQETIADLLRAMKAKKRQIRLRIGKIDEEMDRLRKTPAVPHNTPTDDVEQEDGGNGGTKREGGHHNTVRAKKRCTEVTG